MHKQHSGFFGLLSAGIAALEAKTAPQVEEIEDILPEEQVDLLHFLNEYQRLLEQVDNLLPESKQPEAQLNLPTIAKQYACLFAEYEAEIQTRQSLLSHEQHSPQRYQRLFKKYQQKLTNPNLSSKQRIRSEKLCNQYGQLSEQYSDRL